ncbi:MAG: hypothetical protein WD648_08480 [Planctomycetaceae bacterium]
MAQTAAPAPKTRAADAPAADAAKSQSNDAKTPVSGEANTSTNAAEGPSRQLPGANGKSGEIPKEVNFDEYLKYLKWKALQKGDASHVSEVALEGDADGDRANLTVTVKIVVHRDNEWVQVPIGLNEAVLREVKYVGKGEYQPVTPFEREAGHRWRFRGKGEHTLVLPIIVPILKPAPAPARRLLLTLPATAVSQLKLTVGVPLARLVVKPAKNSQQRKTSAGADASLIEMFGLGNVLDLQWEVMPENVHVETALQSQTLITLGPTGESLLMEATQKIVALQGSFSEVTVALPPGFDLLKVKGKEYRDRKVGQSNRVTVQLLETTSGPIELNWVLEKKFPIEGNRLTLQGFAVESPNAREQEGTIAIKPFEGLRVSLSERPPDNLFVWRINVSDVTAAGPLESAFTFLQQPFRLVLDIAEVEPYFTVEPRLFLRLSPDAADLNATFRFNVPGGAVKQVELQWPNRAKENWELDPIETRGASGRIDTTSQTDGDTIRIPLVQKMTGPFEISLRARRGIVSGQEPFEMTLPLATATRVSPSVVLVSADENVEYDITPIAGTSVRPLPKAILTGISVPEGFRESTRPNDQDLQVFSTGHSFRAHVTVHPQRVQTETTATVELRDDRVLVTQRISFDVAYEPLKEIQLSVPSTINDPVEFFLNEDRASDNNPDINPGVVLVPTWTSREADKSRLAHIALTEPRIGRFDVIARYAIALPEELSPEAAVSLKLPLIEPTAAEFLVGRLRLRHHDQITASIDDKTWAEQATSDERASWIAQKPKPEIPLRLTYSLAKAAGNYQIKRSLIQTTFDHNGMSRSRGHYLIEGDVSFLVITFPREISPEGFWWNKVKLTDAAWVKVPDASGRYRLDLAGLTDRRENLLTVRFHARDESPLSWYRTCRLVAPVFPAQVWIDESVWELVLPGDQHLFQLPSDYTPRFRWERQGIFWRRSAEPAYADLARWTANESNESKDGNAYPFSRFGSAPAIEFNAMSQSVIVLFGAGLMLAAGFFLLKLPALRNVLSLFGFAFVLAILALWFSAPIKLLLQPAVLGLVLAVVALSIDSLLKKRKTSTVLTLSSPSDFLLPSVSSFVQQPVEFSPTSEAPTTLHHAPGPPQEPVSSSDASGSS